MENHNYILRSIAVTFAASVASFNLAACSDVDNGNDGVVVQPSEETSEAPAALAMRLPIPHQKQTDTGCSSNNWCCGITAGNMATAWLHDVAPTADHLRRGHEHLGLNRCCHDPTEGSKGTTAAEVADVAVKVGDAPGSAATCLTFDGMKTTLRRNLPIAVAIKYGKIARRCATFTGNHMVLVTGFDEERGIWIVNDPLCATGPTEWPSSEFRSAASALASHCSEAHGVVFSL